MFTGIVEEIGTIAWVGDHKIRIAAPLVCSDANIGDSIAVNGCCLTVTATDGRSWDADVSEETVKRTSLRDKPNGSLVNLERAVRASDRLGGHLVQGHVDGVGEILAPVPDLRVRIPSDLTRFVVQKGSITIDGVSLTVVDPVGEEFHVAVIPHTSAVTTLGQLRPGDTVNIEVDVIAKYVDRLAAPAIASLQSQTTERPQS